MAEAATDPLRDIEKVRVYAIRERVFGSWGGGTREGMLLHGPSGWGEFGPGGRFPDAAAVPWLAAAVEQSTTPWPARVRDRVPVYCTVPEVDPEVARELVTRSGCRAAKVKVTGRPGSLGEDQARVEAVRAALGRSGAVSVDAEGAWDVDTAVRRIRVLDRSADGLEYVERPCVTPAELVRVRARVDVRIAAEVSGAGTGDPRRIDVTAVEAADLAVVSCGALGGVRPALWVAERSGLPCVVSSAAATGVGTSGDTALAAALPELPFACGLGTSSLLESDLVGTGGGVRPVNGYLSVPAEPPRPDSALLAEHAPTDPVTAATWLARLSRVGALLKRW